MNKLKMNIRLLLENKIILSCLTLFLLILMAAILMPQKNRSFENTHTQIGALAAAIHQHYSRLPNYWGLSNAQALHENIVPQEMRRHEKIICALGREVTIGGDTAGNIVQPGSREFMVSIPDLSKKACQELSSMPMAETANLSLLKIVIESNDGLREFAWGGENPLPITSREAKKACGNHNTLSWIFE